MLATNFCWVSFLLNLAPNLNRNLKGGIKIAPNLNRNLKGGIKIKSKITIEKKNVLYENN